MPDVGETRRVILNKEPRTFLPRVNMLGKCVQILLDSSLSKFPKFSALAHNVNNGSTVEVLQAKASSEELWMCYRKVIFQKHTFL